MKKLKRTSHEEMEAEKIREDMAMSPQERLLLSLKLMDLSRALTPDNKLHSSENSTIKWKELKRKDGTDNKRA